MDFALNEDDSIRMIIISDKKKISERHKKRDEVYKNNIH